MQLTFKYFSGSELLSWFLGLALGFSASYAWAGPLSGRLENANLVSTLDFGFLASLVLGVLMALINAKNSRFYALLLGMGLSFGLSMLTLGLWMPYTNHHAAWAVLVSGVGWALGVMVSGPARKLAGNIFWFAVDFSRGDFERTAHPPR